MSSNPVSSVPIGLREIHIENFRGIDELTLSFPDGHGNPADIFVIGGPNGGGKTAVLEACLLAIGRKELVRGAVGPLAIRAGAKDGRITAKLKYLDQEFTSDYRLIEGMLRYRNETTKQDTGPGIADCLYFSSWRAPRLVGALPISAGRNGVRFLDKEEDRIAIVKQSLINAKAHALMSANGSPGIDKSLYQRSIQRLNDAWQCFYPGKEQQFLVEPASSDPDAGFDVFLRKSKEVRLPLDALSSGQLELFALFGSLIRLEFECGLVLIDEPELHLDPQWHAPLLRALRRSMPQAQILVATHSGEVYDAVPSFQRCFLVPPGDPREIAWKTRLNKVKS